MDTSNTKYRIRQCSECSDGLEYFCETCSRDLCLECSNEHFMEMAAKGNTSIHNVIKYREKSKYLKKHDLCLKHPNSVYDNFCEFCNIPICSDCTEHRTHKKTDVGTAYETKRRQNKAMIQKFAEKEMFCDYLLFLTELDFKMVSEDVANINSELQILSKNLTGYIDSLRLNFPAEFRCKKLKKTMKRCIASTQIYEHIYEHSSIVPIKFLLSVKKAHPFKMNNRTFLKRHCKATLRESRNMEYLIELLPTINITSPKKRIQSTSDMGLTEKMKSVALIRTRNLAKSPPSILTYVKCFKMLSSKYPTMLQTVFELEKPPFPIGVGPVDLQGKRKFTLSEILSLMKDAADEMIKRKIIIDPKYINIPNMCIYVEES